MGSLVCAFVSDSPVSFVLDLVPRRGLERWLVVWVVGVGRDIRETSMVRQVRKTDTDCGGNASIVRFGNTSCFTRM